MVNIDTIFRSKFEQHFSNKSEMLNLDLTLSRIDSALADIYRGTLPKVVHIAGTNGKGSTAYFIAQMLHSVGYKTLLFTSPHIHDITERIKLNLEDISREFLDDLFLEALPTVRKYSLSYFESIFLVAMLASTKVEYDFLILETGVGGRLDATNTSFITEKIPVITTVAKDHERILGSHIRSILDEKLAIISDQSNNVFLGQNEEFILQLVVDKLPSKTIKLLDEDVVSEAKKYYKTPYVYNYANAYNVVNYILSSMKPDNKVPVDRLAENRVPIGRLSLPMCRQERYGNVLLDGAHNPSGILSLLKSVHNIDVVVLSSTKDRDIDKVIRIFKHKGIDIILTTIPNNDRSIQPDVVDMLATKYKIKPFSDAIEAFRFAINNYSDGEILVAGSLYLCASVRRYLNVAPTDVDTASQLRISPSDDKRGSS